MVEMILDIIARTSIERRIILSHGDKITGKVDFFSPYVCFSLFTPYEIERPTLPGYECLVRISKLVKGQQGIAREVMYAVNINSPSKVSFEAPEDGEYLVEIELKEKIAGAVRISLSRG